MTDIEEYIFDEDGNPILQCPNFSQERPFADEEDCKDIFHIKGDGYDVTLSLAKGLITWKNVNPSGKKKGLFKGKSKGEDRNTVMLKDVFGVKTKRKKSNQSSNEEGLCVGFSLHVADIYGPNTLCERIVVFEHPSEALCSMYVRKIQEYMAEIPGRPKSVKLFLQAHAGSKSGSSIYKNKVTPLFQAADIHVDCVELEHNEHIKQEMVHINLDDFDCVIAMGGDGTVSKVADGLLTASQKRKDIDIKTGFTPVKAALPLGIIPIGSTNDIARSVMGTDDVISACLYIVLGRIISVDICSVYREDRFMQWGFNCQYGFAGNVLTFRKRYKSLGKRGLEPAFIKALTKAKLRSYKCDIEYIPADSLPKNRKFQPCYRGCDVCWNEEKVDDDGVTEDLVQAFDPLAESNNSDTLVNLADHEDTPWRSRKMDFLNIGLFTLPGRSELAPRGLSKYSHLNDGAIDLVLVKDTARKEFVRMLKRLTNAKNQAIISAHTMDQVYWSGLPGLPKKLKWPVKIVQWLDSENVIEYSNSDNAYFNVMRAQLVAFNHGQAQFEEIKNKTIVGLKKKVKIMEAFQKDLEWAIRQTWDETQPFCQRDDINTENENNVCQDENRDSDIESEKSKLTSEGTDGDETRPSRQRDDIKIENENNICQDENKDSDIESEKSKLTSEGTDGDETQPSRQRDDIKIENENNVCQDEDKDSDIESERSKLTSEGTDGDETQPSRQRDDIKIEKENICQDENRDSDIGSGKSKLTSEWTGGDETGLSHLREDINIENENYVCQDENRDSDIESEKSKLTSEWTGGDETKPSHQRDDFYFENENYICQDENRDSDIENIKSKLTSEWTGGDETRPSRQRDDLYFENENYICQDVS